MCLSKRYPTVLIRDDNALSGASYVSDNVVKRYVTKAQVSILDSANPLLAPSNC